MTQLAVELLVITTAQKAAASGLMAQGGLEQTKQHQGLLLIEAEHVLLSRRARWRTAAER